MTNPAVMTFDLESTAQVWSAPAKQHLGGMMCEQSSISVLVLENPPAIPADLKSHSWLASTLLNRCLFAQQNHMQSYALLL